jgi:hypothetical protein
MWGEQKKQIYHYTMHTQIFTMFVNISIFAIFCQKYFNSKYNLTTFFNRELSNNSIWTYTDIPNTCRDIIVLYVSDTWIRVIKKLYGYSIFCFVYDEGGKWNSHQMPCAYSSRKVKKYRICPIKIEIIHGRHRVVQIYTWAGSLYS